MRGMADQIAHDVDVGNREQTTRKGDMSAPAERRMQPSCSGHRALDEVAIAALVERDDLVAQPDRGGRRARLGALQDVTAQE